MSEFKVKALRIIILIFIVLEIRSQTLTDTLSLYFEINQFSSEANNQRVDSLLAKIAGKNCKMKILAFADFLNNSKYNLVLSQKRADAIRDYIQNKNNQVNITECKGMGEKFSSDNGSRKGEARQRRVDLIYEITFVPELVQKPEPVKVVKKDTVIAEKKLEDLKKGESLAMQGLNFIPGRHVLMKESVPVLEKLLKTMLNNPKMRIEIQGHICCVTNGEDGYDMDTRENKLSYNRAKAIYIYLIKNGVDASRLTYKGYGRSKPLYNPEKTAEQEQANRRVEILVLDK